MDKMSKKLLVLFLVLGLMIYVEDIEIVVNDIVIIESLVEENVVIIEFIK